MRERPSNECQVGANNTAWGRLLVSWQAVIGKVSLLLGGQQRLRWSDRTNLALGRMRPSPYAIALPQEEDGCKDQGDKGDHTEDDPNDSPDRHTAIGILLSRERGRGTAPKSP